MQQRALAHARLADDREPLALGEGEVETAEDLDIGAGVEVGLVQVADLDQVTHSGFSRPDPISTLAARGRCSRAGRSGTTPPRRAGTCSGTSAPARSSRGRRAAGR